MRNRQSSVMESSIGRSTTLSSLLVSLQSIQDQKQCLLPVPGITECVAVNTKMRATNMYYVLFKLERPTRG